MQPLNRDPYGNLLFKLIEFDLSDQCLNEELYLIGHKITLRPKPLHRLLCMSRVDDVVIYRIQCSLWDE